MHPPEGEELLDLGSQEDLGKVDTQNDHEAGAKQYKAVIGRGFRGERHCPQPGKQRTGIEGIDQETADPDFQVVRI